ncbi:MAG: PAS domain-containing protein [Deltaproteobacteria bacterium]|nr:PAS domain-containing protein [Deltaproteobacteria bacterium]MBK9368828.1 PAS domain-containing protein [Deltaproteobacteria bacterium]MBK9370055.1 PAS domain-containing protein [Deltaproteobacteria bacterium]MBK9643897.1 PAS domain-containing protein [Deltaproteobacteria bacterium]
MSRPLELILARQWAALLSTPVMLFDMEGSLIFFNEAAGLLLGRKYDETGSMVGPEWQAAFPMEDEAGRVIGATDSPVATAIRSGSPVMRTVTVRAMDGVRRKATVTVFPVHGLERTRQGAVCLVHPA